MNPRLIATLRRALAEHKWTTLIGLAACAALGLYYHELTPQQVIEFILVGLLGLSAADGSGRSDAR
jgi:hypothetical protein